MSTSSSIQWFSLVGSIWLQTINGANSDFPVYSSQLKEIKHISQVGLNILAFASDAGKLFGWFSGIAATRLPLWLVAVIGAALGLIGYGFQYLFLESSRLTYLHIFVLTALAGNGICWINTVCYLICINNFPRDSRIIVGLSTSYVGLSAKVYNVVARAIFHKETKHVAKDYLLLNATVPTIVIAVVAPLLRVVQTKNLTRPYLWFMIMFAITILTGVCALLGSIGSVSRWFSFREQVISLGVLLATPMVVPVVMRLTEILENMCWRKKEGRVHDLTVHELEGGGETFDEIELKEENMVEVRPEESQEVGGLQMLTKVDFWLYFFSYMFSATLGLVFLNNLGQIAESRGLEETSTLVSLSSSFGFFGRLLPLLVDYYTSERKTLVSRPASMATLMAPMVGAFFLLLHPSGHSLYISTAIIGACTGAITSVAVSTTTELFGVKNFGVNHNILVANIPVGSFVFGYVAAILYQRGGGGIHHICMGTGCYEKTFIIWGITCSLGTLLCTVLYMRTRKFCR